MCILHLSYKINDKKNHNCNYLHVLFLTKLLMFITQEETNILKVTLDILIISIFNEERGERIDEEMLFLERNQLRAVINQISMENTICNVRPVNVR